MNVTKFFLTALAVIAVAFAVPPAARATGNPAAAPPAAATPAPTQAPAPNANGVVDPNAPVKGADQSLEAPWAADEAKKDAAHKSNDLDNTYVGPVDQGGETATLDTPHRSDIEVADFLTHAITEILSMGVDPTDKQRKKPNGPMKTICRCCLRAWTRPRWPSWAASWKKAILCRCCMTGAC